MSLRFSFRFSLRFKLALLISLLIGVAVIGVTFIQLQFDRSSSMRVLGASQYALVTARAQEVDKALAARKEAVETLAATVPAGTLATPEAAQAWLRNRLVLAKIFTSLFLVDEQGRVLAAVPFKRERIGVEVADRAYFRRARDSRAVLISEPLTGRPTGQPQIVIAAPIIDAAGAFRGELLGVLDILNDDVLGVLAREKIGATGYFAVIARDGPVLLSHPDATQVMRAGRTFSALSLRAAAGWEGWDVGPNTRGEEVLTSYRQVKNAPWAVGAVMPLSEALAPLAATRQRILLLAFGTALAAGLLGWWLIDRETRVLEQLRSEMEHAAAEPEYIPRLDTTRRDELGALARSFTALMTHRARLKRQILDANADLDTRLDARSRELAAQAAEMDTFLYTLGHDLRAPLRAVQGFATMVLEEHSERIGTSGRNLLGRVIASGRHMSALVDGMLELGRISKTRFETPLPVTEMNAVVADVLRRNALPLDVFDSLPALPSARGDARLLHDVWGALLDNAVKFSARMAQPRVSVSARLLEGEVEYAVADNGVGFDAAYADSLFRPFSRLNAGADYGGIGLGLAIAKRALDKMGGRARCVSSPGNGATFYFTLPALHATPEDCQKRQLKLAGGEAGTAPEATYDMP